MKVAMEVERDVIGETHHRGWHEVKVVEIPASRLSVEQMEELQHHRVAPGTLLPGGKLVDYQLPAYEGPHCVYTVRIANTEGLCRAIDAWRKHREHVISEDDVAVNQGQIYKAVSDLRFRGKS
jgi:hypothetical protein